jgi:pyruvate/2-oxoacid:ferredoxin oxidoreductase alpha subunit
MMQDKHERMLLSGNHAVAWAAKLCRPGVIPVYPITPQTPILEKITEFTTNGEMNAEIITPESEHSAMAGCITASLTGSRVFTATSSQGLLLMHELLHYGAGTRASIVMFNVNRTVGSPWGFWPDQTDSLAQRDTGWIQYYTESGQESLDTVIQAFKIAEKVNLPTMISHDAFYVSHAVESTLVPNQDIVDEFLPPINLERKLDPTIGQSVGSNAEQPTWRKTRMNMDESMQEAMSLTTQYSKEWAEICGREQTGIIEQYRCDDAELVFVTMGSMCGTVREAIDVLRDQGKPVGLLKINLFRPFPCEIVREALNGVPQVIVLDRNYSPGLGGILHQELRSALYGIEKPPKINGYLAGVGGVSVAPEDILGYAENASDLQPLSKSEWV